MCYSTHWSQKRVLGISVRWGYRQLWAAVWTLRTEPIWIFCKSKCHLSTSYMTKLVCKTIHSFIFQIGSPQQTQEPTLSIIFTKLTIQKLCAQFYFVFVLVIEPRLCAWLANTTTDLCPLLPFVGVIYLCSLGQAWESLLDQMVSLSDHLLAHAPVPGLF